DRHETILERVRRIGGVVLEPELAEAELRGEARRPDERSHPGTQIDAVLAAGQQRRVAPDRSGTGRDRLARRLLRDRVVVVDDLERGEAELTHVQRLRRVLARALAAAQTENGAHIP